MMMMKGLVFKSVTTVECKQKIMDYDTLLVYQLLLENPFFSITRMRFDIFPRFFEK